MTYLERKTDKERDTLDRRSRKTERAKVKIRYRKLQVDERKFIWRQEEGLKEQNFWSRQISADP